jgi:hypothetical protein
LKVSKRARFGASELGRIKAKSSHAPVQQLHILGAVPFEVR